MEKMSGVGFAMNSPAACILLWLYVYWMVASRQMMAHRGNYPKHSTFSYGSLWKKTLPVPFPLRPWDKAEPGLPLSTAPLLSLRAPGRNSVRFSSTRVPFVASWMEEMNTNDLYRSRALYLKLGFHWNFCSSTALCVTTRMGELGQYLA